MFTDIVGSTAMRDGLVAEHGEVEGDRVYRERYLDPHNARIRALLETHNGYEVKTIGDAFLISFAQPSDAVLCAAAIQQSLRDEPIGVAVRIGMHTGAATYANHDYDGHAVNIAARVESLLKGGERVYCSRETAALAKNLPGIRYHSYGAYVLKGVSQPVEIIDVLWDAAMQPAPPPQPNERLPYPWLTSWVGREVEMETLATALCESRLVTLHGIGGVGKTRLAAETLLAKGGGLPREIVFVSLEHARNESEGLLDALRDALGLTEVEAPDFERLCRHLHGGDRLLLLDNFESVRHAAKEVPRIATTPGVRVLVTSQQALNVFGEHVVELERMTPEESRRLFISLAQRRDANWLAKDEHALRDVLAATDGLPYLIEIVAVAAPKRRLRQLADELKTRLTQMQSKDPSRVGRHVSVQACLEWALDRLPMAEREALPRLAIFAGSFDAEAAEAIASTAIESLDTLVDASLVRFDRGTDRYSLLPTICLFARERLSNVVDLAAKHARWFLEQLDRADHVLQEPGDKSQAAARLRIMNDLMNLQQAITWAEHQGVALFDSAVNAFQTFLSQTYHFSEKIRLNEALLRQLSPVTSPKGWARAQNNLGVAYRNLPTGDRGENLLKAIACYKAALRVRTEHDYPTDWATTQTNLGVAYRHLPTGDHAENLLRAIECHNAALRVRTEISFPVDWAYTQNNLGVAYVLLAAKHGKEHLWQAIKCFEAALRIRTERNFPVEWAQTENNLGTAYLELPTGNREHDCTTAIACFKEALRVYTEFDFPADWAMIQNNLGVAHSNRNLEAAIMHYETALRVWTERDFPALWARTQSNMGFAHVELSERQSAIACFEAAARGFAAVGLTENAEKARQQAEALKSPPEGNPPPD